MEAQNNIEIVETAKGHRVAIKKSLSAREYIHLKNFITAKMKIKVAGQSATPEFSGEDIAALESETVKTYVVSFNDKTEGFLEEMLDALTAGEYAMIYDKINTRYQEEGKV